METSVAAAIAGPHWLPTSAPANWVKGDCDYLRLGLGAIRLGRMYSFHAPTNTSTPSDTIGPRPAGMKMRVITVGSFAPSNRTASRMFEGTRGNVAGAEDSVGAGRLRNDQAGLRVQQPGLGQP